MPFQCILSSILGFISSSSLLYSALMKWYILKNLKGRKSEHLVTLNQKENPACHVQQI